MPPNDSTTLLDVRPKTRTQPSQHSRNRTDARRRGLSPAQEQPEQGTLQTFDSAILAVRWATTIASIALASEAFVSADFTVIPWVAVVVAINAVRTITPVRELRSQRAFNLLLVELGLVLLAITATGYWHSPLIFSLGVAITIASFGRGFGFGLQISSSAAIAITVAGFGPGNSAPDTLLAVQWTIFLLLSAIVTGYGRRLSLEANEQYSATLEQVSDLTEANALLFSLQRVARTLPASLDLEETMESTESRLRSLIEFESSAILLLDEADQSWLVARRNSLKLPTTFDDSHLPGSARQAVDAGEATVHGDLAGIGGGFGEKNSSALYAPLLARGSRVGLLALEHTSSEAFDQRDLEVLRAMSEPVALAIDNARLFRRLRTVGADEERTRIARDLHDRIGQSLAYLAFEVDRISHRDSRNQPITEDLVGLRGDLRTVIGEVRDTLYDLRSDVAAEKDMAATLEEFAGRVAERSKIEIKLDSERDSRLPILQEREMWRIAQEALINVERHADASQVTITWTCDGTTAALTISDNGRGIPDGHKGRIDSYGVLGMRERAASIGASLEMISNPGEGTSVRCYLEQG